MPDSIKTLLGDLSEHGATEDDVERIVTEIIRRARGTQYPEKSLAAVRREAKNADVSSELLRLILDDARTRLKANNHRPSSVPVQPAGWLTPAEAASQLSVPLQWVLERLETTEARRLLGYPWFDGRRWHIPAAACDSNTRSLFLSKLPDEEPRENVSLLTDR